MDIESNIVQSRKGQAAITRAQSKKNSREYNGVLDRARTELLVAGNRAFVYCTPHQYGSHRSVLTPILVLVMAMAYAYMTGAFLTDQQGDTPSSLHRYIINSTSFTADFLIRWGGLYGPNCVHEGYRLLTYSLIHENFIHCASNIIVVTTFGVSMEHKLGVARVAVVWLVSTVGGALFALSFGQACTVTVGCSGVIFGLIGLYIVDLGLHFKIFRLLWFLVIVCMLVAGDLSAANSTSSLAHAGGFVCGLVPSLLFIPHLGHEVADAVGAVVALVATLILVPLLFSLTYARVLPDLSC